MRHLRRIAGLIIGLAMVFTVRSARAQAAPAAGYAGSSECMTCHEDNLGHIKNTPMGKRILEEPRTDLEKLGCEACHGPAKAHAESGGETKAGMVLFGKNPSSAEARNAACLQCHDKGNQISFESGRHAERNVACSSCHSAHDPKSAKGQLKAKTETETCFACHKTQRAQSQRTSHHPVREGKMSCTSCHNPHEGNRPKMLKTETVNELCYTCHAEKRGPFLFEHAPVMEDCATCHEPHGSNHDRMVKQKLPTLCWNCHLTGSGHFGSGDNLSTEKGVSVAPAGAPSGFPTVNSRFIGRSCAKCHANIHGSNSPSGAYFIR
jgi:DmsE family decaheme c-type cytochrome